MKTVALNKVTGYALINVREREQFGCLHDIPNPYHYSSRETLRSRECHAEQ